MKIVTTLSLWQCAFPANKCSLCAPSLIWNWRVSAKGASEKIWGSFEGKLKTGYPKQRLLVGENFQNNESSTSVENVFQINEFRKGRIFRLLCPIHRCTSLSPPLPSPRRHARIFTDGVSNGGLLRGWGFWWRGLGFCF